MLHTRCEYVLALALLASHRYVLAQTTSAPASASVSSTETIPTAPGSTLDPAISTPLPIVWDTVVNTSTVINYQKDLGPCTCDLTLSVCDPNCCCDPDCTLKSFSFFSGGCIDQQRNAVGGVDVPFCSKFLVDVNHIGDAKSGDGIEVLVERSSEGALCVVFDRSPVEGFFYPSPESYPNDAAIIEQVQQAPFGYSQPTYDVDATTIIMAPPQPYKFGDPVQIFFPTFNVTSYLPLPSPSLNNYCNDMNPAKFLAGTTTSCARPVQCAPNTVFDAAYYTSGFVIVTDPSSTGKTIPLTINAPTCIDPVTGIQTPCFSPTTLPTPLWNATASVCSQVVLQVRYTFTYSVYITTTIITAATVDLAFGQISAGASSVLQTFSTVYVVPPTNVSTLPVPKSGNPGYIVGKPLLVGTLVKNGNQSAIAYTPNPQYGLTVPTDVFFSGSTTPSCPPAGSRSQRLPVLFGYDSLAGCTLSYTREDLTNNCAVIRGRVLEVQTLAVAGITHVGRFGNASWEDLEGWVQISNDNSSATAVLGTPDPAGTCSSLLTELDIQILTAPLGSKINPQPAILAMRINYVLGRFQYRCTTPLDCATVPVPPATTPQQSFRIKTTVSFVEIENRPEMLVPPAPRIVPPLPQDVFYPFKIGGSGKGLDGQKWRILFGFGVGLVLVL